MKNKIDKNFLISFSDKIKEIYEKGKIKAPIHLSGNNEIQLIKIFKKVNKKDWVFSTWRSHYHALLHGIPKDWLMDEVKRGRSMKIINKEHNFVISAIVGGIIPQALGTAWALKQKGSDRKVWCFIGDMGFETGEFHLCYKYAKNFDLPLQFVVEDNNLSTNTPTDETWGKKQEVPDDVIYYQYERGFPHHGSGTWVLF